MGKVFLSFNINRPQRMIELSTWLRWRHATLPKTHAGQNFWARGYFVSTVGREEATIREYIRNQEKEDQRLDQMNLWK